MFKRLKKAVAKVGQKKPIGRPIMHKVISNVKTKQAIKKQEIMNDYDTNGGYESDYEDDYSTKDFAPLPESTGLGSLHMINQAQEDNFNGGDESFGGKGRAKRKEKSDFKIDKKKAKNEKTRAKASKKEATGEARKTRSEGKGERNAKVLDTLNQAGTMIGSMIGKKKGGDGGGADEQGGEPLEAKKPNYLLWGGIGLAVLIALIIAVKMMSKK